MSTKDQSRAFLLLLGGIFFLMSAVHLVRFSLQPSDIWWTPMALRVPLGESRDRVEIYVSGGLLQDQIKAGRLLLAGGQGTARVEEAAIGLRFNNWDRVRAQQLAGLLSFAAVAGAAGTTLLFAALGWTPRTAVDAGGRLQ